MSDLDRIREALHFWTQPLSAEDWINARSFPPLQIVTDAARRFLQIAEREPLRWCAEHDAESVENHGHQTDECWRVVYTDMGAYELCRIVDYLDFPVSLIEEDE